MSKAVLTLFVLALNIVYTVSEITCANVRCAGPCLDTSNGPKCCSLDDGCSIRDYETRNCIKCGGIEYDNQCYAICGGIKANSECTAC